MDKRSLNKYLKNPKEVNKLNNDEMNELQKLLNE